MCVCEGMYYGCVYMCMRYVAVHVCEVCVCVCVFVGVC